MSEHTISLRWARQSPDFAYETYDRTHSVRFEGGQTVQTSAAPAYLGRAEHTNPEELLVASLSSCHMLTFLAIAAKGRLVVDEYVDEPVGILEKNAEGRVAVTKVTLRPKVTFAGESPTAEKLRDLHDKAHRNCMIANSVKTEVTVAF